MGEAKRRRELSLPPKLANAKKLKSPNKDQRIFSLLPWPTKNFRNYYPAAPFVTVLLVLIVVQIGFSINN